jgi:hypothetical protein
MRTNHHDICKFSKDEANYNVIKGKIQALILGNTLPEDKPVSLYCPTFGFLSLADPNI